MAIKQIQLWLLRLSNNICVSRVTKQIFDSFKGNTKKIKRKNASTCNFQRQFGITKIEMAIKKPSIVRAMANCRGTRSLSLHPGTHTHIHTDAYVLTVAVVVISFLLYESFCLLGVWAGERRSLWLCFGCCVDIWWNKSDICVKVDDFVLQYLCCISAVFCVVFSKFKTNAGNAKFYAHARNTHAVSRRTWAAACQN